MSIEGSDQRTRRRGKAMKAVMKYVPLLAAVTGGVISGWSKCCNDSLNAKPLCAA